MTPELQTVLALLVVAVTATWLGWRVLAKRKQPGCGEGCSAVSREVRELQARLAKRR